MTELYEEPIKIIEKLPDIGKPEMSPWQSAYLCGLIREKRPEKILEVGVSAGGTTAIILNCLSLIDCHGYFTSVDISENYYIDSKYKSGFMAEYAKKIITKQINHEMKIGIIPNLIDEIGDGIDFLILDTLHKVPGEILDFLVCLPYLKEDAVVVLHDVILHRFGNDIHGCATQLLLDCVTAEKMPVFGVDNLYGYPNIAAFRINKDTRKYIYDVFSSLLLSWQYDPGHETLYDYRKKYIEIGYSENCIKAFDCARNMLNDTIESAREYKINITKQCINLVQELEGKSVYIYGAGIIGRKIHNLIADYCDFKGYIVSDGQKADQNSFTLSDVLDDLRNATVYIAVGPDKAHDIMETLDEKLINNYKCIDINLFDYIYWV